MSARSPRVDAEHARRIVEGFLINSMHMRDAVSGKLLWEQGGWHDIFRRDMDIHVPSSVLRCKAVSREMNFTSMEAINKFRLVQIVTLHGQPIEEWKFDFGFVIPGSTNSWQCTIEAAPEQQMIPAEQLSGNVVLETLFFDGELCINKTRLRVFYDAPEPLESLGPVYLNAEYASEQVQAQEPQYQQLQYHSQQREEYPERSLHEEVEPLQPRYYDDTPQQAAHARNFSPNPYAEYHPRCAQPQPRYWN